MKKARNRLLRFCQSELFEQLAESSPIMLVDVGARGGIHPRWKNLPSGSIRVLGFEPDSEECKRLNEKFRENHTYLPVALHNRSGRVEMNIERNAANSSIYLPNRPLMNRFTISHGLEVTKSVSVKCDTLDRVLKANNIHDVDFVKVDTQGSELQILEGARGILRKSVFGVDVEVEFSPIYKDQPLFSEVDSYLRGSGFVLFDIDLARLQRKNTGKVWSKGQVFWAHTLYFKDFLCNSDEMSNQFSSEKAIRTIAIAELHGFSDFALELLDLYAAKKLVDSGICKNIRGMLVRNARLPETQLLNGVRFATGQYLKERTPIIYNLIKRVGRK